RRNDDSRATDVLDARLRHHAPAEWRLAAEWALPAETKMAEELLQVVVIGRRRVLAGHCLRLHARSYGDVNNGRSYSCGQRFHGTVERQQRADARIINRRGRAGVCGSVRRGRLREFISAQP